MFKKIKGILADQLKKGTTPEKITQSVLGGALIGIFPLIGTTTALSALAASVFKLSHVVIQSVNYLMYAVQILMIPVYVKVVSMIFDVGDVPIRPDLIVEKFSAGPMQFIKDYGMVGVYAVILWMIASAILYTIFYPIILKIVLKIKRKKN